MARPKQMSFEEVGPIKTKVFSLQTLTNAKIKFLEDRLEDLTFSEVTWLSKIEEFYREKEYITEKQVNVLHSMVQVIKARSEGHVKRAVSY